MRGAVYQNSVLAGYLEKLPQGGFRFRYTDDYFENKAMPAISLTMPKTIQEYASETMFSFFQGLLSEGVNKDIQCRLWKIDEDDDFTRLLRTASDDTIGAITIKEVT
jgi:serine/threonine-protein kinase HipA